MANRSLEQLDADLAEAGEALEALKDQVETLEVVYAPRLERRVSKIEASLRECLNELQWLMDRVTKLERSR